MIIAIVGKLGCGKSTVSRILIDKTGFDFVEVSDLVKKVT